MLSLNWIVFLPLVYVCGVLWNSPGIVIPAQHGARHCCTLYIFSFWWVLLLPAVVETTTTPTLAPKWRPSKASMSNCEDGTGGTKRESDACPTNHSCPKCLPSLAVVYLLILLWCFQFEMKIQLKHGSNCNGGSTGRRPKNVHCRHGICWAVVAKNFILNLEFKKWRYQL